MGVAGIQGDGAVGIGGVKGMLAGEHGWIPAIFSPSLGQKPAVRASLCKLFEACYTVCFVFSEKVFGERTGIQGRMESVQMGVMQSGADESVFEIFGPCIGANEALSIAGGDDCLYLSVFHADGQGFCFIVKPREHVRARDNKIGVHCNLLTQVERKKAPKAADVRSPLSRARMLFRRCFTWF